MINGFTGTGLNELIGALARSKYGRQSPPRNVQPMPKADTVQVSGRGRELAASITAGRPAGPAEQGPVGRPAGTEGPVAPVGETSMLERIKAAFLASEGDEAFDASADLNRDGRINHADLAALRNQDSSGDELSMLDRIRTAFLAQEGDESFDASVDLNGDGKINHADLAALRAQESPDRPEEMLQSMRSAFFSRAGDDGFDASVDLNGDGAINFADLAMLRAKLAGSVTRPPAEPLAPPAPAGLETVVEQNPAAVNPRIDDQSVTLDAIRSAFFTSAGDAGYTAAADVNGDGRVNFADLARLKAE